MDTWIRYLLIFLLILEREEWREGNIDVREIHLCHCRQTRYVCWQGIEPRLSAMTFQYTGQRSNELSHTGQGYLNVLWLSCFSDLSSCREGLDKSLRFFFNPITALLLWCWHLARVSTQESDSDVPFLKGLVFSSLCRDNFWVCFMIWYPFA